MPKTREKSTVQVEGLLLADLQEIAERERRPIEALVEEAIAALIAQRRQGTARPHAMFAYGRSHARYAALYKKLAQ